MASVDVDSLKVLMEKISDGVDLDSTTKSLAVMEIPLDIANDLRIVEALTPLSGSPLLAGAIHEILKKLEGKKERKHLSMKRRTSSKKSVKARRSSGGVVKKSQEMEEKENEKVTAKRLFKKKETQKKKESAIWKRISKKSVVHA